MCRECVREYERAYDRTPRGKSRGVRYNHTPAGRARKLRHSHGYGEADSIAIATMLVDPYQRCAVCGVPHRWIQAKRAEGWRTGPFFRLLTVDHIQAGGPSTFENSRVLCHLCNANKGANRKTDEEVLYKTRQWYENRRFSKKDLWWLHSSPGRGGKTRLGTKRIHP